MTNAYPARCEQCNTPVPAKKGTVRLERSRHGARFRVWCVKHGSVGETTR